MPNSNDNSARVFYHTITCMCSFALLQKTSYVRLDYYYDHDRGISQSKYLSHIEVNFDLYIK